MKRLIVPIVMTVAVVAIALSVGGPQTPAPRVAERSAASAPSARATAHHDRAPDVATGQRTTWAVSYRMRSTLGPNEGPSAHVTGRWQVEGLVGGRLRIALTDVTSEGHALVPTGADLRAPAELIAGPAGELAAMGFAPQTPATARRMLTALAAGFWLTPGDGETWTVEEEDGTGRYVARYARVSDTEVVRTIERYLAIRGEDGLRPVPADQLTGEGETRFHFDGRGLARVDADARTTWAPGGTLAPMSAHVRLSFERTDIETVARRAPALDAQPLSAHVDHREASDQHDAALVGDADAPALLAEVARVAGLDPTHPDAHKWRHKAVERLAALTRIDPAAVEAVTDAIHENGDDMQRNGLLIGALGSADSPTANAALADLLDGELPSAVERNVIDHLALSEAPTMGTVAALRGALRGAHGDAAITALGAQARHLDDTQPEAAETIVDQLIERYAAAESIHERVLLIRALGNTGSPDAALPLAYAVRDTNLTVASAATFALRFIPGDHVDSVLLSVLVAPTGQLDAALRAIAWRDATIWRPRIEAVRGRYANEERIVEAFDRLLASWNTAG